MIATFVRIVVWTCMRSLRVALSQHGCMFSHRQSPFWDTLHERVFFSNRADPGPRTHSLPHFWPVTICVIASTPYRVRPYSFSKLSAAACLQLSVGPVASWVQKNENMPDTDVEVRR